MFTEEHRQALGRLLAAQGLSPDIPVADRMAGDGSDRQFFRFSVGDLSLLAVLPSPTLPLGMAEARAAHAIGLHFSTHGAAVPRIYGFAEECGLILFEDLGDTKLHDLVLLYGAESPEVDLFYREALAALAHLQTEASQDFQPAWCWDTPRYDRELMLTRESGYFQKALCEDFLGMNNLPRGLIQEFVFLADRALQEPADFILHRDFQSRNLMVHKGKVRIIDFQGARMGPLGYDLASLLIDPYAGLSLDRQQALLGCYLDALASHIPLDRGRFIEGYYYMALQRNLQILGAFAFLSKIRGKQFFRQFIKPAARTLHEHLAAPQGRDFPTLRAVVQQVRNLLEAHDQE
ncbi:aminoglycoside phosphotransferase family protein [Thiovibrio frasassiensis]|uniref:Phosphotransferase n=1 Tax=Thiovibrio frasassiensis TaxID=2984131 RepID=A0A9X4MI82_9BACT|nr:phosphotransferase [Thiovibrio frasassiensis]MDG4476350.1 phosphotransferase [Thiovibrio frasassiensis]